MSVERPTEATYVPFLLEELGKRGVRVDPQVSYVVIDGSRQQPDAKFLNGGIFYLEAELGPRTKLFDGLKQAYDYRKYLSADGAFAVLFPEDLRQSLPHEAMRKLAYSLDSYAATAIFADHDPRPTLCFDKGTLVELADWIAEQVLKPPSKIQPSPEFATSVLAHAVTYMTAAMRNIGAEDLEDIFGGRSVFENILQYEKGKYPVQDMRRAAAYLVINQIMFYHALSKAHPDRYEALDESKITKPNSLAKYFYRVLKDDYTPAFGFDVVSRLPSRRDITQKLRDVTKRILSLSPEKIDHDVLGQVFHKLIPQKLRKRVAAFYTNPEAAEMLAKLAIDNANARVMDLAVGSGTLLVAAYHRKRELLQKAGQEFKPKDHRRFLEKELTGIDIMPFAAHLAVVHLSLQEPLYETERVRVAVWDSTELTPNRKIPAVSKELREVYKQPTLDVFKEGKTPKLSEEAYIKKGAVTLDKIGGEEIQLERVNVVIMNPPFTRQERVPESYKAKLVERFEDYPQDVLHGQLGLYGYFIPLADRFLQDGGRMAFVLPSSVLRVQSTDGIRRFLVQKYHIEYVITAWQRAAFSEATEFREILLVAKKLPFKERKNNQRRTTFVTLRKLPQSREEALRFADEIRKTAQERVFYTENDRMSIQIVTQKDLSKKVRNLFTFIAAYDKKLHDIWDQLAGSPILISIQGLVDRKGLEIVRGIETKSKAAVPVQATYILRDASRAEKKADQWVIAGAAKLSLTAKNRFDGRKVKVPFSALKHALRSHSTVPNMDLTDISDYVVGNTFSQASEFFATAKWSKIKSQLPAWEKYVESRLCKAIMLRRFDMSAEGTGLFAYFSATPIAGAGVHWDLQRLPEEDAKIFCVWLNSTLNILQIFLNRIETRGAWTNLHEYALVDLLVLDPKKLTHEQRRTLLDTFKEVKDSQFPSLLKQLHENFEARRKIDAAVMRILGISDKEVKETLDYLYPALADEIERLKALMAGKGGEEEEGISIEVEEED